MAKDKNKVEDNITEETLQEETTAVNANQVAVVEPKKKKKKLFELEDATDQELHLDKLGASLNKEYKGKGSRIIGWILAVLSSVFLIILVSAITNILKVCFDASTVLGICVSVLIAMIICIFIIKPIVQVLSARYFMVDLTKNDLDISVRHNKKALRDIGHSIVKFHTNLENTESFYVQDQNVEKINTALENHEHAVLLDTMKEIYGSDIAKASNQIIMKSAGRAFLTTSISQNDKIDSISVLLVNLNMIKQIVGIYGYRPSYAQLMKIYSTVLRNALIAYGMQNVNFFNVFSKFFGGVASRIPLLDTLVDSTIQGTISAFLTILVGYKTKKYLCQNYRAQEKIHYMKEDKVNDEEVNIAINLAKNVNADTAKANL